MFDIKFCADAPTLLGVGGGKGKVGIWNILELEVIQQHMPQARAALGEDGRVMGGAMAGEGTGMTGAAGTALAASTG